MSVNTTDRPVLILGANGLLGSSFSRRARSPRRLLRLTRGDCDITNANQIEQVFSRHNPAAVINCAAYTKVDQAENEPALAERINVTAIANLAHACKQFSTKLIHISTDFVFDGTATKPYQPTDNTNPLSVYGRTKRDGEKQIETINSPGWLIARTSWLFGAAGPCFPRTILNRCQAGQTLTIVNDQIGSPTYAPDLAEMLCDLIAVDAVGVHHVTNGGECSWFDFARAVVAEFDLPTERIQPITTKEFLEMRPIQAIRPPYSVMTDPWLPRPMRPWRETLPDFHRSTGVPPVSP